MIDSLYSHICATLIHWWKENKTLYPWRRDDFSPERSYHVWLSEIMLQQTTVATVSHYFIRFIDKWPTLNDLANSSLEDIFVEWQGLGYYSRARNLHKAAQILRDNFPQDEESLKQIPGIGPYTAAAISSIAFNRRAVVIDGNVRRVVARLFGLHQEKEIETFSGRMTPSMFPGDYAQSIMDFGRLMCKPRNPECKRCPLQNDCYAYKHAAQESYPVKKMKPKKQQQYAVAFIIVNETQDKIWIEEQNDKKLLKNLMTVPMTPWIVDQEWEYEDALSKAPITLNWLLLEKEIKHEFTHITLRTKIFTAISKTEMPQMIKIEDLPRYPLSTLVKKIIQAAF